MHPIMNVPDSLAAKIVVAAIVVVALVLFIRNYMKNGRL